MGARSYFNMVLGFPVAASHIIPIVPVHTYSECGKAARRRIIPRKKVVTKIIVKTTLRRQETRDSTRGRKPMYHMQATVTMETATKKSDMNATAAAGPLIDLYRGPCKIFHTNTCYENPRKTPTQTQKQNQCR